jgi:hypothetical protein
VAEEPETKPTGGDGGQDPNQDPSKQPADQKPPQDAKPEGKGKEGDKPPDGGGDKPPKKDDDTVVLGKPKGEAKPADKKVPEKYEIKLPEHSQLSQQLLEKTAADARERGLSNAEAQDLLNERSGAVSAYINEANAAMSGWLEQAKADEEIGGDNFEKSVHLGNQALEKFASPELQELLHTSKLGNHPEVIRFMRKIGEAMADDTIVKAPAGGQPVKQKTNSTPAKRMFPNTKPKPATKT